MSATAERMRQDPLTLEEFEARREPAGLFLSYARARWRHWPFRQILPIALGIVLLQGPDPIATIWTAVLVILADMADSLMLRRSMRRPPPPERLPLAQGMATLTAALHGLAVAAAVISLLMMGPEMRFIAATVCIGMILDSALQFALNPTAGFARMLPHAVLLPGIYFVAWGNAGGAPDPGLLADTLAAALMMLFGLSFIGTVGHQRMRSHQMQRATLQQAQALRDMNHTLKDARRKTRRLAHVVEQTQDAVLILDRDGTISWTNAAYAEMMGLAPGRTGPGSVLDALSATPEDRDRLRAAIDQRRALRVDTLLRRQDGTPVWLDVALSPMREDHDLGDSFVAVIRDISDHKRRETALAEARTAAEAAARAKTTFLATMSHEIRTPMNGVIATSDLLLDTALDGEQRALVETISSSGEALLTIINDILDFTKLDAGKLETTHQPFEPERILRAAVGLVAPLAEAKALQLQLSVAETLPEVLIGDESRIRQILINLLGNAIKFTERGGIRVVVDAAPCAPDGRCALRFSVIDTGVGIAPDRHADIFETFTQADATITRRFGGTGLGLAISRRLARAMGGDIEMRSRPGEGSRFTLALNLPVSDRGKLSAPPSLPDAAGRGASAQGAAADVPPLAGIGLLVAEDNRTNRMLIGKMLADTGAALRFAETGADALRLFADMRPDAILMDMSMPVMDGLEATERIRALEAREGWPPCPIIALTANAFEEDRRRCLQAGMNGHLSKPIRKAQLLDTLRGFLSGAVAGAETGTGATGPGAQDPAAPVQPPQIDRPSRAGMAGS